MGSSVSLIMQLNLEKVQRSEHGRKESLFFLTEAKGDECVPLVD